MGHTLNKKATKTNPLTNLSNIDLVGFNKDGDNLPRKFEGRDLQSIINTSVTEAMGEVFTTTVDISSAQILTLGTTAVELLPDPGTNKYYAIQEILFEMTAGSTGYFGLQEDLTLNILGGFYGIINDSLLGAVSNTIAIIKESVAQDYIDGVDSYYPQIQAHPLDVSQSNILLTNYSGNNPTLGDGTLRVILEYKIRTFNN